MSQHSKALPENLDHRACTEVSATDADGFTTYSDSMDFNRPEKVTKLESFSQLGITLNIVLEKLTSAHR